MSENPATIVTGAGGGIGRAVCLRLATAGHAVVAADLDQAAGEETARLCREAGAQAVFRRADVADGAQMRALVEFAAEQAGGLHGLVNNAGIEGVFASLADYPEDVFDKVMRVNARSVFLGLKYALPVLLAAGAGAIVNVASTSAVRGRNKLAGYVASKHAVLGLTRVAALEATGTRVRVNAVLPGPVTTRMTASLDEMVQAAQAGGSGAGLGRAPGASYGRPEDIAGVVAFLMSDDAGHVNGAAWTVDAGTTVS